MNTTTTQLPFDWVEYEEAAGELYWTIWREQPRECLRALTYDHPFELDQIVQHYAVTTDPRYGIAPPYRPFRPGYLFVIVAVILLCITARPVEPAYVVVALIMLVSPLIPAMLVYVGGFIIVAEAFVSAAFLGYTTLSVVLSWSIHQCISMRRRPAATTTNIRADIR